MMSKLMEKIFCCFAAFFAAAAGAALEPSKGKAGAAAAERPAQTGTAGRPSQQTGAAAAERPAQQTGTAGRPAQQTGAATAERPAQQTGAAGRPAQQTGTAGRPAQQTGTAGRPAQQTGTAGRPSQQTGAAGNGRGRPTGRPNKQAALKAANPPEKAISREGDSAGKKTAPQAPLSKEPAQPQAAALKNLKSPASETSDGRDPAGAGLLRRSSREAIPTNRNGREAGPENRSGREAGPTNRRGRAVELGLEYPLAFGLHGKYMLSRQWHVRAGAGFMAEFFLSGFSKIMPYTGYLDEAEIQLISDILKNSLYAEIRLGWTPYFKEAKGGPYLELGLSHASYGKGEVRGSVFNEAGGFGDDMEEETLYSAKTNILSGSLHLGYQIPFERLRLNLELGLIKILKAEAGQVRATTRAPGKLNGRQRQRLNSFLEKKGWIAPTFSVWLGFAF